jgi:hypothetical protein
MFRWLFGFLLVAAMVFNGKPHVQSLASTPTVPATPVIREEQKVLVNGISEAWRLEWKSPPTPACGPEDMLSATTCPCSGFAYGESGQLDLVRSKDDHEIERLELTPFYDEVLYPGHAVLRRWEPQEQDLKKAKSEPQAFLAQVHARPVATVMRFADYNHDDSSTEFFLQTDLEPCGKVTGVVVGVTPTLPRLHVFGTALHPDKPLVMQKREWEALLKANEPTEVLDWACGDHGSEIESDLTLTVVKGAIHVVRREFECTDGAKRGRLLREQGL